MEWGKESTDEVCTDVCCLCVDAAAELGEHGNEGGAEAEADDNQRDFIDEGETGDRWGLVEGEVKDEEEEEEGDSQDCEDDVDKGGEVAPFECDLEGFVVALSGCACNSLRKG